ncbi:uncharacterized protein LOC125036426 [Penaeus chinensis]|uniref:uncharacterized protein LOC125036426 n=1 Tax=Penaeus chinensis TaxID=139456 RepID=UPI001FB6E923|nr:uncharacterized protein LOC125036426 [Penaeus chinensis]
MHISPIESLENLIKSRQKLRSLRKTRKIAEINTLLLYDTLSWNNVYDTYWPYTDTQDIKPLCIAHLDALQLASSEVNISSFREFSMNQKHVYILAMAGVITLAIVFLRLSNCVSLPAVFIDRTQSMHDPQPAPQKSPEEYEPDIQIENIEQINLLGKTCSLKTSTDPEDVFRYMDTITIRCNTPYGSHT